VWLDLANGQQASDNAGGYYNYLSNPFEATANPGSGFSSVTVPKYLAITQLGEPASSGRRPAGGGARPRGRVQLACVATQREVDGLAAMA
jgi:hypothetical protein